MNIGSEIVFKQLLSFLWLLAYDTPVTGDSTLFLCVGQQENVQRRFIHDDNSLTYFLSLPSSRHPFHGLTKAFIKKNFSLSITIFLISGHLPVTFHSQNN